MSQRSFYRRNSKIKGPPSSSTTCVEKEAGKCPVSPVRKHHRKYKGVRCLSFTPTLSDDSTMFLHGRENKLLSYLLLNEPTVLAQILSVRYTAVGQPISDFIMSLFLQGEKNRERPKRSRPIAQSDVDEENDPDIIGETDLKFLAEVVKEQNFLSKRRSKERNTLVESIPTLSRGSSDDLQWISKEMESDWKEFLHKVGCQSSAAARNVCQPKSKRCFKSFITLGTRNQCDLGYFNSSEDAAFVHDMYALGRRTLGIKLLHEVSIRKRVKTLRASFEEKHRFLNQDPFSLKPNGMSTILPPFSNPAEVAMQMNELLKQVSSTITTDAYLTSEKVLYPELNSFSTFKWNIVHPFPFCRKYTFTLEVDKSVPRDNGKSDEHTNTTSYQSVDDVVNYCSTLLADSPDSAFLQTTKEEIRSAFTDADVDTTTTDIDNLISEMEKDICSVITKIERLQKKVQLECRMHPIFELETHSNKKLNNLWRHKSIEVEMKVQK